MVVVFWLDLYFVIFRYLDLHVMLEKVDVRVVSRYIRIMVEWIDESRHESI